jgi:paraquat-inducible protein B
LLTGGLKIELVDVEGAERASLPVLSNGLPVMPTTDSDVSDAAATVEGVFNRINSLPIEELLNSAITFLNAAERLVTDEDLRGAPQDVRALLADVRDLVGSENVQNIPVALNATLSRVEALVADLEEQQLTTRLVAAIEIVTETAAGVTTSVEGVPELIKDLSAVAKKADALAVEDLVAEVTALIDTADTLLKSEAVATLPASMKEAVDQVNASLSELRAAGTVAAISDTFASARTAAANVATTSDSLPQITERLNKVLEDAAAATANINSAASGVPELIERIQAVAAKAESLEINELVSELTKLTRSADTLISAEDAKALPRALKRALDEVNYTLQTLREGGTVENVNRTLASARNAADSIATSTQDLPAMVARLNRLFAQASRTIEGYDKGDELNRSAQATLRDIQKAADALASLARTIERNPNSLLLGR